MTSEVPKRGRGRPRKEGIDKTFAITIPKHHYEYLEFLALQKHRLGASAKEAAEHILVRELNAMEQGSYHDKEFKN